jgi:hypothetical protein
MGYVLYVGFVTNHHATVRFHFVYKNKIKLVVTKSSRNTNEEGMC